MTNHRILHFYNSIYNIKTIKHKYTNHTHGKAINTRFNLERNQNKLFNFHYPKHHGHHTIGISQTSKEQSQGHDQAVKV